MIFSIFDIYFHSLIMGIYKRRFPLEVTVIGFHGLNVNYLVPK